MPARWRRDDGSAPAEFALVVPVVTLLFLAVLQLGADLYARNVLSACAADAARYGAAADVASAQAAADRVRGFAADQLGSAGRTVEATPAEEVVDGAPVVVVRVLARLPTAFGLLPSVPVHVEGRALLEAAR